LIPSGYTEDAEPTDKNPILAFFLGCCASAMTATASNTTATRIDGAAALFIAYIVLETITRTIIPKTIIKAANATTRRGKDERSSD
jgi:hypothetical protein